MTKVVRRVSAVVAVGALALVACSSTDDGADGDGGPVALDIRVQAGVTIPEDDPIREALEEVLDIDITMTATAGDDYGTQLSADVAAGDLPDMFQLNRVQANEFSDQGLLLDVTEYLDDELAPYAEAMGEDSVTIGQMNEGTYATVTGSGWNYNSFWIRKDWLDNLGLDVPETIDDFYDVAVAFTEDDPDGNGHDDTYGLGAASDGGSWSPIWPAFGSGGIGTDYGGTSGGTFYEQDGEVVHGFYDPNTREALEWIQELVATGAVDPDFMTLDSNQAHERAMQGTVGMINIGWPNFTKPEFVDQYREVQPDAEWIQMLPPTGPDGESGYSRDGYSARMYGFSAELANEPEKMQAIFDLINYSASEEGRTLVSHGIEGVHYNLEDGEVVPTQARVNEGSYMWIYQFTGRNEGEYLPITFPEAVDEIHFAQEQPTFTTLGSLVLAPDGFSMGDSTRFAQEGFIGFVTGDRSMDEYDEFLETLANDFGHQEYVAAGIEQLNDLGFG
ncbi:extracellular solute-binding protein [Ruania halotolerans]|uniref:extracellular solute-binding protein n=1 Tax=Ruania halotolerans TaxID=2897773 RepID=UPI001E626229|nr:extracellular solute-binding protein [Ruania halotolerans]UFU06136.1 extracellular solute-binding protein [Ruania halotolerans]